MESDLLRTAENFSTTHCVKTSNGSGDVKLVSLESMTDYSFSVFPYPADLVLAPFQLQHLPFPNTHSFIKLAE